jgi:hypothetical protein
MNIKYLIPHFDTHILYFDDKDEVIYADKYKQEKYLNVPVEVAYDVKYHLICNVFCWFKEAFIYRILFRQDW